MTIQLNSVKQKSTIKNSRNQSNSLVDAIKILSDMTRRETEKIHSLKVFHSNSYGLILNKKFDY